MVTSVLDEARTEAGTDGKSPLSEESEREILEMVEDQLDRRNPPDTRVLYRRAMHFIDRDVRHLSLQQFNAKFPLRVKRRRARDPDEDEGASPDGAGGEDAETGPRRPRGSTDGPRSRDRTMAVDRNADVTEMEEQADGSRAPAGSDGRREVVRETLLDFAKAVAGADDRGEVVDVLAGVEEYVDQVVEEL